MGSSAWYSELRANLAVPSAESPSTMNSSVRSLSVARQSASFDGQRRGLQGVLPALGLLVLPGRDPRLRRAHDLLHQQLGLGLLGPLGRAEELLQLRRHHLAYDGARGGGAEDLLGLALELRLGQPHRHDRGEPFEDVVLDHVGVVDLERLRGTHHVVERLGEGLLEATHVGAALGRGDHVDVGAQLGVVAGPPAGGDVDGELALDLLGRHVSLVVEQRHGLGERVGTLQAHDLGHRLVVGQELDELGDATVVAELLLDGGVAAQVADDQLEAGHDERGLPGPAEQSLELEPRVLGEDLPVRPEADAGAGLALRDPLALARQPRLGGERARRAVRCEDTRDAAVEADALLARRPVDVDVHPCRQRVHDRQPDAVEAAGGDVRAAAELAAGVELGRHDLDAGQPGLGFLVGGDATSVVVDLHGVVVVEGDLDPMRGAGQGLVHAVVDDLPEAVHQAGRGRRADVHPGTFADRLQPLEDEEVCRVVRVVDRGLPAVAQSVGRAAPNLPATRRTRTEARVPVFTSGRV